MRKMTIFLIILIITGSGFLSGCIGEENKLQITTIEKEGEMLGQNGFVFTITLKIENTGSNDVSNAEVVVNLYSGDDIIDSSSKQLGTIEKGWSTTTECIVSDYNANLHSTYKAVATIYLGDKVLDVKNISW